MIITFTINAKTISPTKFYPHASHVSHTTQRVGVELPLWSSISKSDSEKLHLFDRAATKSRKSRYINKNTRWVWVLQLIDVSSNSKTRVLITWNFCRRWWSFKNVDFSSLYVVGCEYLYLKDHSTIWYPCGNFVPLAGGKLGEDYQSWGGERDW